MSFHLCEDCHEAVIKLKEALALLPFFELMCDAFDYAIGIILGQPIDKKPNLIYYASQTLNDVQLNYTAIEKEFLAVVFGLKSLDLI